MSGYYGKWKKSISAVIVFFICVTAFGVHSVSAGQSANVKNVLLIGQDKREGEGRQRSDTMIVVTLNKTEKRISLTSFMRDLYVTIPGYTDNRINAAYQFDGMELLDETIEDNFGIHIDGNVEVDFDIFQILVDKVGGIDIELTQEEADYICGRDQSVLYPQPLNSEWDLQEGMNRLSGEQALIHVRNRSVGNSDYRRTERQREVLMAAFDKLKDTGIIDLIALIREALPMITTDISLSEMIGYAMDVLNIGADNLESYRIPADGTYSSAVIRGMQVLVPDLPRNRQYLQETLYAIADKSDENEKTSDQ